MYGFIRSLPEFSIARNFPIGYHVISHLSYFYLYRRNSRYAQGSNPIPVMETLGVRFRKYCRKTHSASCNIAWIPAFNVR